MTLSIPSGLELFSLRDGEAFAIYEQEEKVPSTGVSIAVQLVPIREFPTEDYDDKAYNGEPVCFRAVIAARRQAITGLWQWVQLSPITKERIGDLLHNEMEAKSNTWYFCHIFRPMT